MWLVYILLCRDRTYYTGSTNNLEKRLKDHLAGKGARYTKSHKPERIVYQEGFATKSDALKRESEIKKLSRLKKEELVNSDPTEMLYWHINANLSIRELLEILIKRGGRIDKYYLQDWNKNKHTIIYLNGWFGGRNIREALLKALL